MQESTGRQVSVDTATRVMLFAEDALQGDLLSDMLVADGYNVILAKDSAQAIRLYHSFKPDVILIDLKVAGNADSEGVQAARGLREINPELFIPILFISSQNSPDYIKQCLESGAVDYLTRPYNPAILKLKIQIYKEITELHEVSRKQRDQLAEHARYLESSYHIAEEVFNNVMQSDVLKSRAIKYILSPIAIFNGDILLAAFRPSGELNVLLGDFTGHGLSAAIGAIPVSDIFYGMTEKGFSITEIAQEINTKLHRILPRGLFLAAAMVEYSRASNKLTILNAGLPDVLVYDRQGQIRLRAESKNFPFGINHNFSMLHSSELLELSSGDCLMMFTDGVTEAKNQQSEQFGFERVVETIHASQDECKLDALYNSLQEFVGNNAIEDDVTIITMDLFSLDHTIVAKNVEVYPDPVAHSEWKMTYSFGPDILRQVDPLPNIVQTLMQLQKLHRYKQDIFVILKELYVNAFDHGLLGMDSSLKNSSQGFSAYMREREKRLSVLKEGIISIEIIHSVHPDGGALDVYVYDSGEGFDVNKFYCQLEQPQVGYHGMGLRLVNGICESLEFNDTGNEAHARYVWKAQA